jgi:hypothetical protein
VFRPSLAAAATAAVGLVLAGSVPPDDDRTVTLATWHGGPQQRVELGASAVRDLYPGAIRTIRLTARNPNRFPIRLSGVRGAVLATSRPGCRPVPSNLEVLRYRGRLPLILRAGERRDLGGIAVRMPDSVADACRRTRFTIRIFGDASRAVR